MSPLISEVVSETTATHVLACKCASGNYCSVVLDRILHAGELWRNDVEIVFYGVIFHIVKNLLV